MQRFKFQQSIWFALASGTMVMMVAIGFGRFSYTPMIPIMMDQVQLSVSHAGLIASVNFLGYLLGALTPLVWKGEHTRLPMLRWGIALTIIGFCGMAQQVGSQQELWLWSLARFCNGVGSAWIMVNISSLVLERLSRDKRLSWMGVLYAGVGLGALLASLVIAFADGKGLTWRQDWWLMAILSVVFSLPSLFCFQQDNCMQQQTQRLTFSVINRKEVWLLALAYLCKGFSYIIVLTFLPVITMHLGVWSNISWLLLLVVSIPSAVFWGWASTRFGNINSLQAAYILQMLGMLAPVLIAGKFGGLLCAILVGGTFMGIVTMSLAQARFIDAAAATMIMSLITGVYSIGQVFGPAYAGYIAQLTGSFSVPLISAALLMALGIVCHQYLKGVLDQTV